MQKTISTEQTPANIAAVLAMLAQSPKRFEALAMGLSAEQLRQPLGEGERSYVGILAHVIHCEARTAETIFAALTLNTPHILPIHPERQWGSLLRHDLDDYPELQAYFAFRRKVMLRVLHGLTERQWARGVIQDGKQRQESVYWQARGQAMHELEHVAEMEHKRGHLTGEG